MKVVQGQTLLYTVERCVPDNKTLSELNDLLVRMSDLVSDIIAIDEVIKVSKYILRYNCKLPYTKHDLNLMRSVEDLVLSCLIDVSDEHDTITVYDNYVETLDRMENMLRNDDE